MEGPLKGKADYDRSAGGNSTMLLPECSTG